MGRVDRDGHPPRGPADPGLHDRLVGVDPGGGEPLRDGLALAVLLVGLVGPGPPPPVRTSIPTVTGRVHPF
jgi:hypothetical protein